MNKEEKKVEIDNLKARFVNAQLAVISDYKGIKVNEFNQLRNKLRAKDSEIKVVKNRLAKIALQGTSFELLKDYLKGTAAVTITNTDPVAPAKVLIDFSKDNEKFKFKAALMQGKLLTVKDLEALAKLPSREVLISKLMGSMQAPARNLVSVMAQIPRQVVNVLAAIRDKKEKGE